MINRGSNETMMGMTGAKVDLEKARREKLCFNCGKGGHQAKSCKAKSVNAFAKKVNVFVAADQIALESKLPPPRT